MQDYSGGEGLQYRLQVRKNDVGRYVIMPGNPEHCEKIAKHFDDARLVADSREYTTYTGCLDGEKISVTSTDIDGPSAPIALEELVLCGANTFIQVGTCGGMKINVKGRDIVVAVGTIRMRGTGEEYTPIKYPAVADLNVTNTLVSAAKASGYTYHAGVVEYKDAFYGQHEPGRMSTSYKLFDKWEAWRCMRCKASEMESAALFIATSHLRVRYGSDFLVVGNRERQNARLDNPIVHDTGAAIKVAVKTIRRLIKEDRS